MNDGRQGRETYQVLVLERRGHAAAHGAAERARAELLVHIELVVAQVIVYRAMVASVL